MKGFFTRLFEKKSGPISTSAELSALLLSGDESSSGISVTPESAMRYSTVYQCVKVLSESVAQLPCILYQRQGDNEKERARAHPLFNLLRHAPNEWQTAFDFLQQMLLHLNLRGNFYAYKNIVGGEVRELLPLHPDRVTVKQQSDFSLVYTVKNSDGAAREFTSKQIWQVRGLSSDGCAGLSPIAQQRNTIGLGMSAQEYGSKTYKNGARLAGILTHPGKLDDKASKRLAESWSEAYGGLENAAKTAVLEEGMTWKQVSMSTEDAQYIESRKLQRTEIAGIFRVPPHKIGDLEHATFSNIEHQSIEFVTDCLMPWLVNIEQSIWLGLLGRDEREEYFAEFLVDSLLRGDNKTRMESYQLAITNGIMSPNEVRQKENMNPREGGDVYYTPLNMATTDQHNDGLDNADITGA